MHTVLDAHPALSDVLRAPLLILVVDDEESVREVFSAMLECDGHTVIAVSNFSEAATMLDARRFDGALVDGNFPLQGTQGHGKLGPSLCALCALRGVPAVLVTGDPGAFPNYDGPMLTKPVTTADLRGVVAQWQGVAA
jgi:CheY-like chemotaxis protein